MLRCVWDSQAWGWGCSWPRVGGGHRCCSTSSNGQGRRPTEGDAAQNSKRANAEEHCCTARDSKRDKRRKQTDCWKVLGAEESAPHMEARASLRLSQHSKNEVSQGGHAPKPETPRQAARLALTQAGGGPRWLPVDAPGPPEAPLQPLQQAPGPRSEGGQAPAPRDHQPSRANSHTVPGALATCGLCALQQVA